MIVITGNHIHLRFVAPSGLVDFEVWLNSNPIRLGVAHADADGIVEFDADLPGGVNGDHHVVVKGIGAGGKVSELPADLAFTGASSIATAIAGLALVMSGLVLTRFRRRRTS